MQNDRSRFLSVSIVGIHGVYGGVRVSELCTLCFYTCPLLLIGITILVGGCVRW